MFVGGVDGAIGDEILDGGTVGIGKGAAELVIGSVVDGNGVTVAVEGAVE